MRAPEQVLALEEESRPIRSRALDILEIDPKLTKRTHQLCLPGTITFFLGRSGSPLLAEVEKTIRGNLKVDRKLVERVLGPVSRRKPAPTLAQRIEALRKEPVLAEVRYGGKTLASHLFARGKDDVTVVVCPYNGGRLAKAGFTLVEHFQEGTTTALHAFAVVRMPPLTEIEQAAVRQIPDDQYELNVGVGLHEGFPTHIAFTLVGVAVGATVWALVEAGDVGAAAEGTRKDDSGTGQGGPPEVQGGQTADKGANLPDALFTVPEELFRAADMSAAEVVRLGPAGSARKLLKLRRELLLGRKQRG